MLYIDNQNLKIIKQVIRVGNISINNVMGHNIFICLEFLGTGNKKGYLHLSFGFLKDANIDRFLNKVYYGIPFENKEAFITFEVFDTNKFLDTEIESEIVIRLNDISNEKVGVFFLVDDSLIKIKFDGYLDIDK